MRQARLQPRPWPGMAGNDAFSDLSFVQGWATRPNPRATQRVRCLEAEASREGFAAHFAHELVQTLQFVRGDRVAVLRLRVATRAHVLGERLHALDHRLADVRV